MTSLVLPSLKRFLASGNQVEVLESSLWLLGIILCDNEARNELFSHTNASTLFYICLNSMYYLHLLCTFSASCSFVYLSRYPFVDEAYFQVLGKWLAFWLGGKSMTKICTGRHYEEMAGFHERSEYAGYGIDQPQPLRVEYISVDLHIRKRNNNPTSLR
ncbi:uncharacterized protein LY89DRAFT_474358 [Mollisia scopiformis]|uniref:Uncharacterized protein n=1 Tax=Mollisia scopiformis TaxID=149040 RepID=A0A194XJB4_MOLSC|nr:uncharacterized protein LY89DRAFT_474358 [Mollisia scopiformis]KUJ20216.1 hypothetical protein LY89DRAFT_474358 [Mollisia scopiformis]